MKNQNHILFEKFNIIECLKKDDYTSVYIADHIYLGKKIILKTLNTENITDLLLIDRFKREAKILARLDHPNIIKVLDSSRHKNVFYLSFEYFKSSNLHEIIKNNLLTNNQKRNILIQLARGLEAAHQAGIIHRDIKPENILINENNHIKIADFGLATIINESVLTNKSSIVGTPSYMSPEQIRGEKLTPQSDLFSLGIIIYELFCGENPFLGKDINASINNILDFDEHKIMTGVAQLPQEISLIIKNILQRDKEVRLKSASEILRLLKDETAPQKISHSSRKYNAKTMMITASVIASIIIVFILINNYNSKSNPIEEQPFIIKDINHPIEEDTVKEKDNSIFPRQVTNAVIAGEKMRSIPVRPVPPTGKLNVYSNPDADIFIDSQYIGSTPLKDDISLAAGVYSVGLAHHAYPDYHRTIKINPGEEVLWNVNLDTLFGYLNCNIYPWGEVYIDGKLIGQSPFQKPLILIPGRHVINVENPKFKTFTDSLTIVQKETTDCKIYLKQ
jgi:serine/threonine-protein kinase